MIFDWAASLVEWYSHSDDLRAFGGASGEGALPAFGDDDGDYCDDYDIFFDEYDWEANNDLV